MGRPPGILGTLPAAPNGGMGPMASAEPALNGSLASGNSAQYDQAMNLMSRAQYAEAQAAFRAYADANPSDTDLAPQAIYWVGNISFVRQDYAPAARAFAEVIKKYPKSTRAPDAMLKLAQSFMGMGQKSEGCTTLGLIKTKSPGASPGTLTQAANLRKTACTK
jgi:tol-pal system protein YbgF